MKACVKCNSDLPESALHCVFCGEKQPQAKKAMLEAKTMMGFPGTTAEELKRAEDSRAMGVTPDPVYQKPPEEETPAPRQHLGPHQGPGSGPHRAPAHQQHTIAISPDSGPVGGPPPAAAPRGGPPPAAAPPAAVSPEASAPAIAQTAYVPPGADFGAPPPMQPAAAPPVAQAPMGYVPGQPMDLASGAVPYPGQAPVQAPPRAPAQPPYLASETDVRAFAPHEPWRDTLKTMLLVFGVLLIGCFTAPWSVASGKIIFSWSMLSGPGIVAKLPPLLIAGSAVLAVVFSLTPLSMAGRGIAAGLLGLSCIFTIPIIGLVEQMGAEFALRPVLDMSLAIVTTVTLVPGLVLRSQYRSSLLPRILTTIGVLCALAPYLIPVGGSVPIIGLFQGAFTTPIGIVNILAALSVVITVLGLLVWLPATSAAWALVLAWVLILQPLSMEWIASFKDGFQLSAIQTGLSSIFYLPLAGTAWLAMSSYGIAGFLGKRLERN